MLPPSTPRGETESNHRKTSLIIFATGVKVSNMTLTLYHIKECLDFVVSINTIEE